MTKSNKSASQARTPEALLLATMPPLSDESCASWIQRMGGDHQYSMHKLMQILGIRAPRRDWDLPIPLAAWLRMLAISGIFHPEYEYSLRVLSVLATRVEPSKFLLSTDGRPRYRWCARCLASDPVPYLRWHWRLRVVEICHVHRVALLQACPWCLTPLWTDSCRLVALGKHGLALDLAHCDRCGMPLHDERERPRVRGGRVERLIWDSLEPFRDPWAEPEADSISREVMQFVAAAGLEGAIRHRAPAYLGFGSDVVVSRWLTGTPFGIAAAYARAAANAARLRNARDRANRWTLNAQSFHGAEAQPGGSSSPVIRWSWRLDGEARLAVARALHVLRADKRKSAEQERIR